MDVASAKYSEITVRMPQGADPKPLKAFAEAMGWHIVFPEPMMRDKVARVERNWKPSERLRGIFKMSSEFDYKEALCTALNEKYGQ